MLQFYFNAVLCLSHVGEVRNLFKYVFKGSDTVARRLVRFQMMTNLVTFNTQIMSSSLNHSGNCFPFK